MTSRRLLNGPPTPTSQGAASSELDRFGAACFISCTRKRIDDTSYRFLVLRTGTAGDSTVVGGVILEIEPQSGFAADMDLLLRIASALRDGVTSESRSVTE